MGNTYSTLINDANLGSFSDGFHPVSTTKKYKKLHLSKICIRQLAKVIDRNYQGRIKEEQQQKSRDQTWADECA